MTDKPAIRPKGRFQLKYRGTECLNCGHPLDISDRYCPICSQSNTVKKISLRDFFDEFFSNVLSYDSRLFRTLYAMILRPGVITREYIEGKRMRYTNPFRFMLSLGIIYFLLLGISGNLSDLDRYGREEKGISLDPGAIFKFVGAGQTEEEVQARMIIDSLDIGGKISELRKSTDSLILHHPKAYFEGITDNDLLSRLGTKHYFFSLLIDSDSIVGFQDAIDKYSVANTLENKTSYSMAGSTIRVRRQPGTFANSLIAKLPFATFFFLPLFAVFILLVYIRKRYTYTDNLIFSFHNQSLLFILLIVSFLIDAVFNISTAWLALTIFSILLYQAMRNFYGQGHFKTIVKYLFLNAVFFILAGIAGLIFVLASAFTY